MDNRTQQGIALALQWFGVWLVFTAALMLYGETAPSVADPSLLGITVFAIAGLACFFGGCHCRRRPKN